MGNLSLVQWLGLIGAAALVALPRLGGLSGIASLLGNLFGRVTASASDANALVAAYRLIEPALTAETAAAVRQQLADTLLKPPEAKP